MRSGMNESTGEESQVSIMDCGDERNRQRRNVSKWKRDGVF
jgi:hypothetical protein